MYTRRNFIKAAGIGSAALLTQHSYSNTSFAPKQKKHIVTLSFDDGFEKSSIRTAEIFEKHNLAACINVIASGHLSNFQQPDPSHNTKKGDFKLWNELKSRGHELMMHGYKHAHKDQITFNEGRELILRCIDMFSKELKGFDPKESIFNFPYNASTPELEAWLPAHVKAFRTGGNSINAMPHEGQVKLTCTSFGPESCENDLNKEIERLLALPEGWLIYNTHGLDGEGWGPMRSAYLDQLLARLKSIETVAILPTGVALKEYSKT